MDTEPEALWEEALQKQEYAESKYLERTTAMNDYIVTWAIDAETETPREAAQEARNAQIREGTWATVFDVKDIRTGEITRVDLLEDEEYTVTEGTAR